MNKQNIIGLVIIGVILFGFSWFQSWQNKKNAPSQVEQVAIPVVEQIPFAVAEIPVQKPEQRFTVENDVLKIEFSSRGGAIADVVLKNYAPHPQLGRDSVLRLWRPGSESFNTTFFVRRGYSDERIDTRGMDFEYFVNETPEGTQVKMILPVADSARVEYVYTIPREGYMVDFKIDFVGMSTLMSGQSSFGIDWAGTGLQNEKGFENENNYTTISYRYPDKKSIETLGTGKSESENEPARVQWVAFKQQFFSSILIAGDAFQGANMSYKTYDPKVEKGVTKDFKASVTVPMSGDKGEYDFRWYFGPNKFSILKQYDLQMERLVPLGGSIIGWISRLAVIPLFDWLGSKGLSFGWIILIMTFIIKLVIFPLTFTSYKSSAKMRVIKPEVDELNAKYPNKDDAMKKQQATMELYRRAGINPMAGCIPMLIQFPIIIAMFRFFPAAIELRGQRLWWAEDLSSYDSILNFGFDIPFYGDHISLFALLMAVSMFGYSWLNFQQQSAQPQMAGMKFMMLYLMPIMLLFWFNNYSSGLCFYYLLSNLFTIVQMYGVRFAINDDKLRARMMENAKKPAKKKSGFMARLEEAQRQQLAAARAQQKGQGKGKKKR